MQRAVLLLAGCVGFSSAAALPNILFVLGDDMGWGDVSYNKDFLQPAAGGANFTVNQARTPNIDAWAEANGTMLFTRFYAGSAVCSPTRSSVLSGRTPRRECIDDAEGCGQLPAWSCYNHLPYPATTFTVAQAAKLQGYETLFVGKWHLGDFWVKGENQSYAMKKWPSSNPGHHGFDKWHATEASAESSTPNCGCVEEWKFQGKGCIIGNGMWQNQSLACTNYWKAAENASAACLEPKTTTRECLTNLTKKIEGDDSEFIMSEFQDFLSTRDTQKPFLAFLHLHTNHVPHYALPEWYHAYHDVNGDWAGNYLGTLSQMDAQIGALDTLLKNKNLVDSTMVWFTADNGPHTTGGTRPSGQNAATNGLRQCKASIFEGGIRVPGFIRWPSVISGHKKTAFTASTVDFLPTVLDIIGLQYPKPDWAIDGVSLLPLLKDDAPVAQARDKLLGFGQSGQWAMINDTTSDVWKIVYNPVKGQCDEYLAPYQSGVKGYLLFNLAKDQTESNDLCSTEAAICASMKKALTDFQNSVEHSRQEESGCEAPSDDSVKVFDEADDADVVGRQIKSSEGQCLGVYTTRSRTSALLELSTCSSELSHWAEGGLTNTYLANRGLCLVLEFPGCVVDNTVMVEACDTTARTLANLYLDSTSGLIRSTSCPTQCVDYTTSSKVSATTTTALSLTQCRSNAITFAS